MRYALSITLISCMAFGWWQNHHASVGGAISIAKVLWLSLALSSFFVVPAFLARDKRLPHSARLSFGVFLLGFILRAAIEAPMLYFWQNWRCAYGITHDALMALPLLGALKTGKLGMRFAVLLLAVLTGEMLNAWLFSTVADPLRGIYFAADSPEFQLINRITWAEVVVLYPWLGYVAHQHSKSS